MKHSFSAFALGVLLSMQLNVKGQAVTITGDCKAPQGTPVWVNNAVFYQIYPQTFYDSNGDGIGDLEGIIQKLDYVKSLGVDGIWLNPFFESPFQDAGYDISDYYKVAPRYGTNDDAKRLFAEAHKRGLKVLFDFVASYTSIQNKWFQESAKEQKSKYSNWYIWTNNIWLNPPKEYQDLFIKGYGTRNGQYMRNFFWCQPALNFGFSNPQEPWQLPINHPDVLALRAELKNVVRFWMDLGADGFRADMAGALVKTSATKGNDQFFNTQDDGTKQFWTEVRAMLDKDYPGSFMVSEWSDPESAIAGGFHSDFYHWFPGYNDILQKEDWRILNGYSEGHSFFDKEGKGNIMNFLNGYLLQYNKTKGKGYISLPLGNHDLSRLNINRTDKELEMIFAFSLTMPGITFVYYGNEIGMKQLYGMPQIEGAYKPRSGARTPMQWTSGKNDGFSTGSSDKLYLPVDTSAGAPNVAAQEKDPNSLLNKVRALIKLKKTEPALAAYGEFVPVYAKENTYPFIFARSVGKDIVLAMFNPSQQGAKAEFTLSVDAKKIILLSGDNSKLKCKNKNYSVDMTGVSYTLYKIVQK
jgi:maltose alpha-D-glucosyltransferase/alpha-amylase